MEQIVKQITEHLQQELPDQAHFFTPNELLSSGIPMVVVETLRKNILSAIESELKIPEFEWIQTSHENVQAAWHDFVEISRQRLRVPASKLSYLLEEAVEQCLELALKPRQAVAEIIFRTRVTIDLETAKKRVDSLKVNKQLGLALLRYMEKKEKQEITKEQARELIKKVDQRLVENYHPLKWSQALKPVFDLAGPSVDPNLFRIFFEDKGKPAYARKFGLLDNELTEKEFIEFLSSADMLDIEEYEDEHPVFVPAEEDTEPEETVGSEETSDKAVDESIDQEEETPEDLKKEIDESEDEESEEPAQTEMEGELVDEELNDNEEVEEQDDREKNIANYFSQIKDDELFDGEQDKQILSVVEEDDSNEGENISLLNKFMFDESVEDSTGEVQEEPETHKLSEQKEPSSIYEEMNLVKDDGRNTQKNREVFEESQIENKETEEELSFKIEADDEEVEENIIGEEDTIETDQVIEDPVDGEENPPMWRSFLERDDLEVESGYEYEEQPGEEIDEFEEDEDDEFIEDPIYDLTTDELAPEEKIRNISGWLDDEKDRFVDEIFMGSEIAYEQALVEIMDYEDWKTASMYLEREVFSRNKIDVYDEVAVDFTDRLHSYFLEHNSKQDE